MDKLLTCFVIIVIVVLATILEGLALQFLAGLFDKRLELGTAILAALALNIIGGMFRSSVTVRR